MLTAEIIITALTLYFFLKVLFVKPKVDVLEDSYCENDSKENVIDKKSN